MYRNKYCEDKPFFIDTEFEASALGLTDTGAPNEELEGLLNYIEDLVVSKTNDNFATQLESNAIDANTFSSYTYQSFNKEHNIIYQSLDVYFGISIYSDFQEGGITIMANQTDGATYMYRNIFWNYDEPCNKVLDYPLDSEQLQAAYPLIMNITGGYDINHIPLTIIKGEEEINRCTYNHTDTNGMNLFAMYDYVHDRGYIELSNIPNSEYTRIMISANDGCCGEGRVRLFTDSVTFTDVPY